MKKLKILIAIASIALVAGACSGTDTAISGVETSTSTSTETTLAETSTTTTEPRTETRVVGYERCRAIRWTELFEAPFEACLETIEVTINEDADLGPYMPIELPAEYISGGYTSTTDGQYVVNYLNCDEGYSITRLVATDIGGLRFIITDSGDTPLSEPPRGDECFDRCYISYKTFFATDDNVALTRLCRYETGFAFADYVDGENILLHPEVSSFFFDNENDTENNYIGCSASHLSNEGCDAFFNCFERDTTTQGNFEEIVNIELSSELLGVVQKYIDRLPANHFNNYLQHIIGLDGFSVEYFTHFIERGCAYITGVSSDRDSIIIGASLLTWFK